MDTTILYILGTIILVVLIIWVWLCIINYAQQRKDYKEYGNAGESYEEFCERFYSHYFK